MQPLLTTKIYEDPVKEQFLKIFADKYARQILQATTNSPQSATEISHLTGIPISTVYRRLQPMIDCKILQVSGSISEEGKKFFMYKSLAEKISTNFDNGNLQIEVTRY